jgi:hypothetical protein
LGNTKQVLPPGVVCDKCNNYFAINVEKPFFELDAIKYLRFYQGIPNKRNKIPSTKAIILPDIEVTLNKYIKNGDLISTIDVPTEAIDKVTSQEQNIILFKNEVPISDSLIVSRFMGKIALEVMAQRLVNYPDGLEYLANEIQFDPLRDYVRKGNAKDWPVNIRRIYDADKKWGEDEEPIQVIYEYDVLVTDDSEYYFVLALFGLEFVINYGGPEIAGYTKWLEINNNRSPLHVGKNNVNFT